VYVSNEAADLFMAHPLLGALHVSADWRSGPNLPWFLDNSSRGPALALLMPLLALVLARPSRGVLAASFALAALAAGLHPLIGLAGTVALFGGACCVAFANLFALSSKRVGPGLHIAAEPPGAPPITGAAVAGAAFLGALAAAPSYAQLFSGALAEPATLDLGTAFASRAASLAASFCVLAPLACYGALRAPETLRPRLVGIVIAGLALAAAVPLVRLGDGNEHVLANIAGVLLAVPALGFAARGGLRPLAAAALLAAFLPVTLGTLAAFAGRPALPIANADGVLVRVPPEDPLAQLYAWIRRETPRDAVFVVDSAHPVKMATNVSELPAFTGRALFVDQPSYLTTPHAAFETRRRIAAELTAGTSLAQEDSAPIRALARPVYLLSHAGDDEHLARKLTRSYGPPLFASGFVAVYALVGAE
jgi:hypothetical protein